MIKRLRFLALALVLAVPLAALGDEQAAPVDNARAVNIMPPGNSGHVDLATFLLAQVTGDYGPHFDDQRELYNSFGYKSMQFATPPDDDRDLAIRRDAYGVPQIAAATRELMFEGFGYAMAQDRLFEMDLFRRAGHGRLAEILGESFVPMDIEVRTLSQGAEARAAELAAADPQTRADLDAFIRGINQYIGEALLDPTKMPAEFVLLNALPIAPWTPDDSLAFGEFAGRFFGEFGHGELEMAAHLRLLIDRHGEQLGRSLWEDLYPLDVADSPPTIPPEAGIFPRHTAPPATDSPTPVNALPGDGALAAAGARSGLEGLLVSLRRSVGLKGFGSNQYIVDGAHSESGNSLLVSEPQTDWAVPSFFWEVEMHSPGLSLRGVTVPGLPFIPIGRNGSAAWAVTSGLDANADTFEEVLEGDGYLHDGEVKEFETRTETIGCGTPPTAALEIVDGSFASVCETPSRDITVRRSVHGPLLLEPDHENGVAYARQSVVDGRIVSSFEAWTRMTEATDAEEFLDAASGVAFSFNFMFADANGDVAYVHAGRYPLRRADIDPRLPIPGTGEFDWQGFEAFADQPHAINPPGGFAANWNNKPAAGWGSKPQLYSTVPEGLPYLSLWGVANQVTTIQEELATRAPVSFEEMAQIEQTVASIDARARTWMPALLDALDDAADPSLADAQAALAAWDQMRHDTDGDGLYDAAGLTLFDRWVEQVLSDTFAHVLGERVYAVASGIGGDGRYVSASNTYVPTFKIENALFDTFTRALLARTNVDYFEGARGEVLVDALRGVIDQVGADPAGWQSPVETMPYAVQGAGSVPETGPLLNRGSYGQIVEPGGAPVEGDRFTFGETASAAGG